MPKIRVTPAALNDLKEIKAYIENDLANPIAANNVIKRIIEELTTYSEYAIVPIRQFYAYFDKRAIL